MKYPDPVCDLPYEDMDPYTEEIVARIDALRQDAADLCGECDLERGPEGVRADAEGLIEIAQKLRAAAFDWGQLQ